MGAKNDKKIRPALLRDTFAPPWYFPALLHCICCVFFVFVAVWWFALVCLLVAFAYCWRIVAVRRVVLFLCLFGCVCVGVAYCWRIVGVAVAFVCVSLGVAAFPCVGLRARLRFCGVLCLPHRCGARGAWR